MSEALELFVPRDMGPEHCSRWSGIPQSGLTDFHRVSIEIICRAFRCGPWNVPTTWSRMKLGGGGWPMFKVSVRASGLATFDFDQLTRLVVGAHDNCIRLEVSPSGPRMLMLRMWPRQKRSGQMHERHPTIEEAISDFRRMSA
ncbi:hypothetical protein [Rhizobium leguminosarum]|uniref:hypothetical protein n=1 Tax=Rhizobium leguminosarum TaxID=384 RepID=UPI000681961F|nr:hypothetical protein [Rhizobium leguminosarum]